MKVLSKLKRFKKKSIYTNSWYWYCYRKKKVVENRILFESFHGSNISDSPLAMLEKLAESGEAEKYEIFYSSNEKGIEEHQKLIDAKHLPVKLVTIESFQYAEILATAHYLINNSSFPTYFIKKKEQKYLQTWHGTPLKTLGKQMRLGIESMHNVQHNFLQADYLMHPNVFTKEAIMRDYNLEELYTGKVVICGYPRNSIFLDKEKAKTVREQLHLEDKTIYAYMPTWRGTSNHSIEADSYIQEVTGYLQYIDARLNDDQILFVNFHPILKYSISLEGYHHIRSFPASVNNYEFLNCTDALITDYSSVFFDYSITGKPIILFTYDYDEYMKDRGMYFDMRTLPFRQVDTIEELTDLMTTEEILHETYDDPEYRKRFIEADRIDAPEVLLNIILHDDPGDLEWIDYSANKTIKRKIVLPETVMEKKKQWKEENIDTFSRYVLEKCDPVHDILVLKFHQFTKELSAYFYDHYADKIQFVFENNTIPTSFAEKVIKEVRRKKIKKKLEKRDFQRTLPHLADQAEIIRNIYIAEAGCSLEGCSFRKLNAEMTNENNSLILEDISEGYTVLRFLFINRENAIVHVSDPVLQENRRAEIPLQLPEDLIRLNAFYIIAAEAIDSKNRTVLVKFCNEKYKGFTGNNLLKKDLNSCFEKPIMISRNSSDEDLVVVPAKQGDKDNRVFALKICRKVHALDRMLQAKVLYVNSKKNRAEVTFLLRKIPGLELQGVVFRYRSEVYANEAKLKYDVFDQGNHYKVKTYINFEEISLRELYWDFIIQCRWDDLDCELKALLPLKTWKILFFLGNTQHFIGKDHIVFPYGAERNSLTYMYRTVSEYDKYIYRIKELCAVTAYIFTKPLLKKRNIWLVFEKFCFRAEDNAYYFFKYCMENLTEEEKKNIYYVIDKNSPDYSRVSGYKGHILHFMSIRHMLYLLGASMYVGADSRPHLFAWRAKSSIIRSRLKWRPIFFLQHGVTAMKRVDPLFGKHGSNPMTYFDCTSKFEQDIVTKYFGYKESEAPVTGFARWDVLEDKSEKYHRNILVMPTWRTWLEEVSGEEFARSDYYKHYSSLLQNKKLDDLLKQNDIQMNFYIHPKFADYLKTFHTDNSNIHLIPSGSEPLNELMMKCHALITDYSSVCWDVFYQKKPVIFYHFDLDQYNMTHGSYIDLKTELFGRKADTETDLINRIKECIESDFKALPEDLENYPYYFAYHDKGNCRRIYEFLEKQS